MAAVPFDQQPRLVLGVGPCPGDDLGAIHRPEVLLEMGDDCVHCLDVEDPLLHEHRFDGGDARLDGCQLFGVVMIRHQASRRYRSKRSTCTTSPS